MLNASTPSTDLGSKQPPRSSCNYLSASPKEDGNNIGSCHNTLLSLSLENQTNPERKPSLNLPLSSLSKSDNSQTCLGSGRCHPSSGKRHPRGSPPRGTRTPGELDLEIIGFAGFLLKDLTASYHSKETILFTIDYYYGTLN